MVPHESAALAPLRGSTKCLKSISKLGDRSLLSLNQLCNCQASVLMMAEDAPVKVSAAFWAINKPLAKTHWTWLLMIPFTLPPNSTCPTAKRTPASIDSMVGNMHCEACFVAHLTMLTTFVHVAHLANITASANELLS